TLIPLSKASVSRDMARKDLPSLNKAASTASFCGETRLAAALAASAPKSTVFAAEAVPETSSGGWDRDAESAFFLVLIGCRIGRGGVRPAFAANVAPRINRDWAMPE